MTKSVLKKRNELFTRELARLNEGQRAAVEQIEGPVLVVAGPGTGKTHILAARIGRILLDTDTLPSNILCLTFTDAGVLAMRQRLIEFIGPEAHRVHIYTFHSFCNKIIQDNLELFGRRDLEPISELERVELIRGLLDKLRPGHPLRRKANDPYFYEYHLRDLFKRMKAEDWGPAFMHEQTKAYLQDLPDRTEYIYQRKTKDAKKGDLKKWKFDDQVEKMNRLLSAVDLYPAYLEAMRKANRYDFDDMILWVLRAFEKHPSLLRQYQEQYLYFLIDEYQDTNGSQNHIIQQLAAYWTLPNLFIVGDDDQSIYEFQGARLKNLVDFYHRYKEDLHLILLKDNYRSSQHILDVSRAVIDHNNQRIIREVGNVEKVLVARHPHFAASHVQPQIVEYPNRAQEEVAIVEKIACLHAEGFPLKEVAVIYARHKQARNLIELLEKKKIPYQTKREVNVLDVPLIQNLRQCLRYLQAEYERPYSGEYLLYQILHFDFLGNDPRDIIALTHHMARFQYERKLHWRDLLASPESLSKLNITQPDKFLKLAALLDQLLLDQANLSVMQLLERLVNRSGWLGFLLTQEDKAWQLQVLKTFFDFVLLETDRNPRLRLRRLLEILDSMDANRLAIQVNRMIHAEDGVQLLTAHSSKGLEFQQVFMLDCVGDYWEPGKGRSSGRFAYPDTLTFSGEEDALEARRRLFYVAMTRAKEKLHLSYALLDHRGKSLKHAQYIDEMRLEQSLEVQQETLEPDQMIEAQLLLLTEPEPIRVDSPGLDAVKALLQGFKLSISSLNTFLRCPLSFFYEYILRVPTIMSEAAAYGTAMHFALSSIFEKRKLSESQVLPPKKVLIEEFKKEMARQKGYFNLPVYSRRVETGESLLGQYYDQFHSSWPEKSWVEYQINNIEVDGVPLTGTIDRIDFLKNQRVFIVDYKTGNQSDSKLRRPTKSNPKGGNYWRQLVFYKILFEAHQREHKATAGAISYLELNNRAVFDLKSVEFDQKDVELVREMIRLSYKRIMMHDFYEGCGEDNCSWCNFTKTQVMTAAMTSPEKEDLDDF
ncbi:MAG: ATP-dependent DNA helicase [Bacteroidota bacterium]